MPWIVLALLYAAFYARLTRGNLIETMGEDYIRTARAKGLRERKVVLKHGLRRAYAHRHAARPRPRAPLGGAVITETVFNLQGLGDWAVGGTVAPTSRPSSGVTLLVAAFFVVIANLVVDVLYAYLDPRVRYSVRLRS